MLGDVFESDRNACQPSNVSRPGFFSASLWRVFVKAQVSNLRKIVLAKTFRNGAGAEAFKTLVGIGCENRPTTAFDGFCGLGDRYRVFGLVSPPEGNRMGQREERLLLGKRS